MSENAQSKPKLPAKQLAILEQVPRKRHASRVSLHGSVIAVSSKAGRCLPSLRPCFSKLFVYFDLTELDSCFSYRSRRHGTIWASESVEAQLGHNQHSSGYSPHHVQRRYANPAAAVARFAEPMAYTSVFPYLPEMIRDFGVEENMVAKWAGLTSSVFAVFQGIAAVPWGKAADRFGRKPILICGLLSTMVCFIVWGMSTSLTMAITVRAIMGAGNGNVGLIRTMVGEMVTEKELQPRAFSIMPLVWSLGSVVGPAFGGFLAQPARQYPDLFGNIEYFKRFPYYLPNLVATFFFLISTISAVLFLKETLASKREHQDWGLLAGKRVSRAFTKSPRHGNRRPSFVDGEATAPLLPSKVQSNSTANLPAPGMNEIFTRQTVVNLVSYTFLALHSVAYDQIISVFLNYPVMKHTPDNTKFPFYFNGGFGLKSGKIGTIFTIYGITCGLIQFLLYAPLVNRYGVLRCYKVCSVVMPFVYCITPYTSLFPTEATRVAALIAVMVVKAVSIIVAFPSITILLTNSCTSLRVLGTLNGFATAFSGFGRALGPASTGAAFSWGADNGYIVSAYFYLGIVAALGAIPVFMIVEGDGFAASADSSDTEGDGGMGDSGVVLPNESAIDDASDDEAGASAPLLNKNRKNGTTYQAINGGHK
ncbi:putative membrane protein [Tolypocladium ophioglossoides CBS 100239]|uniref:Putative membrane protein n=1 Tax=Tolypocladium ophioglossoides (strain CBS 100239) TaxID=1163406 RepID=A0A0L0NB71_TOLOC|nr:putative membrane protein [Tolypocladium ophioglossoides CBS 100239]